MMMKLEPRNSLFVYGTLMAPPVIQTLLGRVPPHGTALLPHYRRHPVRNQVYPGMIFEKGAMTQGILYYGLTPKEIARLDWFEDVEYTRRPVIVTMDAKETATETYVWTNPLSELQLDAEWSIEDFSQTHLTRFLEQTVQPCCIRLEREGL
ncbi:hypothetical protein FisN_19Hu230 [Fistulifera solaris]|uniref:Putative gamma-glutamylcyclotransferase n=1 Tax=Fistulifera solaris TaxID=1519565 RepID=A0A1Z5K0U7_FISSO|nr:hypothetical protein FisN_19Hu230 [Fistulifera solaris]|eukprot:GAX19648.1 hypothetical protein FisN_19Hu230 [Fistulifera solaris]